MPFPAAFAVEEVDAVPSLKMLSKLRFRLPPLPLRRRRGVLLAVLALELSVLATLAAATALQLGADDGEFVARNTLIAQPDLPPSWTPIDAGSYPYMPNSPLLALLMDEETIAGAFSAFRDPLDSSAVASYVIFRPDEPPAPYSDQDEASLESAAPLVLEAERLARQRLGGALPELFFAPTDVPTPGALRGRSVVPPTGGGVQSDSLLFIEGSVLALVVVEHPQGEEPFRSVEELAQLVFARIQEQLN